MTCNHCVSPNEGSLFPYYGVGPHICFYKIPGAIMGQSVPLPEDQWPDNYLEDSECKGVGMYFCPECKEGLLEFKQWKEQRNVNSLDASELTDVDVALLRKQRAVEMCSIVGEVL